MEGPTPVSALIHAATMVTAGVFLIIRMSPVFELSSTVLILIIIIGSLPFFFSATIGMVQNDLKKVIAYSTCSQLGYMIMICDILNSLKECRNEEFLNYLKNIKPEDVTLDCFEKCLKVAIDQDNCTAVGELMLLKPRNVKSCLINALKKQNCYKSTLLLLLCYAVEKHNNAVLKYICETNCSENIELDQIDSGLQIPTSLWYILRSYMIEIKDYFVYPIRIGCSPLVKNYEGIQFILSNFFCDKKKLVANWGNLSLPCFHEEWQNVCMVIKFKNVILSFNCIESISSNKITIYLKSVQRLNLSSNNLKEIPPDLLKLPMLHNLNLSSNKLKHLPDVTEWSQYFTTLSLDNNLLESFPTNVEQVPIKHLYISNNKLASIPEGICKLKYLETLKICGNVNIHALPLNMGNLTKLTLYILNSLKECRNEEFLNYLKNIKPEDVTLDCFEKCLKVAIDQDNCTAVGELMLLKPRNVKSCLINALKKQNCYKSTLLLLLCYAVEKHNNAVLKYICETNCSENIELDQIDSGLQIPTSLWYILRSYMIEIKEYFVYPIKIGCNPLVKNYEGVKFILSNFFCNNKKLNADWDNLSLPCFHEEWQSVCMAKKLKNVILSFNCIENISSNKITFYLKSVQKLNLSSNNLKEIPPDLLKLPMLRNLNLSSNKLKHLPDVKEWSQYFTTLSLDNNLLESFPTNVEQVPIKHLYISNNKLASIPEGICNLKYLETLKICGNVNIHALPLNMGNLTKLTLLDKTGLKINSPPAIKNLNKTEDIMRYLIALKRAAEPYYTMKLMIVGFEAQGKTTLLKRLQDNTSYNENQPTEGMLKILFMESTSVIQCVVNILSI
ncbi:leucine-rich repeat-containing protein 40-like [Hydra vulgaris]|uniref:NADH:ubiquinone reductase (H(+)-translocating) n=1 Tax=Hydra vulgaris TaxID=6087 RepID=A0ABM4CA23_HYDVU